MQALMRADGADLVVGGAGSLDVAKDGTLVLGVYNAFGQYYRFAAADASPGPWKAKAISLVMAGGLVGGIIGPEMSKHTRDLAQPIDLASMLAQGIDAGRALPKMPGAKHDRHHDHGHEHEHAQGGGAPGVALPRGQAGQVGAGHLEPAGLDHPAGHPRLRAPTGPPWRPRRRRPGSGPR